MNYDNQNDYDQNLDDEQELDIGTSHLGRILVLHDEIDRGLLNCRRETILGIYGINNYND